MEGPTVTALLGDGPLGGRQLDVATLEGRPPKTIEVPDHEGGTTCRYCLARWEQAGATAEYTFLYHV